jgi:ADP-ribose pyrophosphatase YjhB (NUDIX family)
MQNQDILIKTQTRIFSYRVAGLLIQDGRVLLQRAGDDPAYAIPGGHVAFGETSEQALIREFREELNADILPIRLLWIGENFFPWGEKDCQQICLYYLAGLRDETSLPRDGIFYAQDEQERMKTELEFSWIELSRLDQIELYPLPAREKLRSLSAQIEHFVFVEKPAG